MLLGLYLSSLGFNGIWFSAGRDQLNQPKKYLKFIIENSYLKYLVKELLKESVLFRNQGDLILKNLTELNARSARADFIIYDEEAQAEEDAYNAAVNILAGSPLGLILHISTPAKATIFETNHDRLRLREITKGEQFVFSRRWDEIARFQSRRDWYEEQQRILPGWYFRQEHECSFELPMGAVFQNVVYDPYEAWLMKNLEDNNYKAGPRLCSGVDWNPAAGHTRVSVSWTYDHHAVVVMEEAVFSSGYAREMRQQEFAKLRPYMSQGNSLVLEDGGINIPYIDWFHEEMGRTRFNWREQRYATEEWDNQDRNKMDACSYIIQNGITIYVDKVRFPNTAKEIEECSWDEDAKGSTPKLRKDSANSPHFLDAFLHAISEKNRDEVRYEVANW